MLLCFFATALAEELEVVTYEQIWDGECDGRTVEVMACRYQNDPSEDELECSWLVKSENGEFRYGNPLDGWVTTKADYNKLTSVRKTAISERNTVYLKVYVKSWMDVEVIGIRLPDETSYSNGASGAFVKEYFGAIVFGVVALGTLFGVCKLMDDRKRAQVYAFDSLRSSIVKTKIVDSSHTATASSKTSTASAIGRAAVGSAIAGPIGAVVGASTAKQRTTVSEKHTTTFMIYFSDGSRKHETVDNNSQKYELYMRKLEL